MTILNDNHTAQGTVPACILDASDGSGRWSTAYEKTLYTAVTSINGPIEVRIKDETVGRATLEFQLLPASGLTSPRERFVEELITRALQSVILLGLYARSQIIVTTQLVSPVTPDDILTSIASIVNSVSLALLDANLSTNSVLASARIKSGDMDAVVVYAFPAVDLVLIESIGTMERSQMGMLLESGEIAARGVYEQLRESEVDTQAWDFDFSFSGIETFAHLPHVKCLTNPDEKYDIAIIGAPFDTAVSFRPGARFGPRSIRHMSQRQTGIRGFNPAMGLNPYHNWAKVVDCGDIPISPFDNAVAVRQMNVAFEQLLTADVTSPATQTGHRKSRSGRTHPRLLTLGGDHSIALPILQALHGIYGPISVLHFDSHMDTWSPAGYYTLWTSEQSDFTHGTMFHLAAQKGFIANGTSVHAGLRSRLNSFGDYEHDEEVGFKFIEAREIDHIGTAGVIEWILNVLGTKRPVYLSIDIDVIDPSIAPGTGTPESGGWTTREMLSIIRGLKDLNLVGADIVEVAPAYDNAGETTALAAADLAFEVLTNMVITPGFTVDNYTPQKTFRKKSVQKDEL
ncbi:hypothetical protein MRB53_040536 [Persea americana]|nr:hypothetical protein MRB53_040536 [Persea americana]